MAQKSITNFFKPKTDKVVKKEEEDVAANERECNVSEFKRRRIASSSDEEKARTADRKVLNSMKKSKQSTTGTKKAKEKKPVTTPENSPIKTPNNRNRFNGLVDTESEDDEIVKKPKAYFKVEIKSATKKRKSITKSPRINKSKQTKQTENEDLNDEEKPEEPKIEDSNEANESKSSEEKTENTEKLKSSEEKENESADVDVENGDKSKSNKANENAKSPQTLKVDTPAKLTNEKPVNCLQQNSDGADYNPANPNYDPMTDVFWKLGEKTPYLALARTFQLIEEIRGRYNMLEILGNFFSSLFLLNPDDLLPAVYLSVNQLAPAYEGLELGVAETFIMKAICSATGRAMKFIKEQAHATGDLGIVAEQSRVSQRMMFRPAPLTLHDTFRKLKEIPKLNSGSDKTDRIQSLLVACRYSEARFIIRSVLGKLRIGLAEQSLMTALAIALVRSGYKNKQTSPGKMNLKGKITTDDSFKQKVEEKALILKIAYCQCPNYDKIIPTLLEHGIEGLLERCPMLPGVPVKPMLAQPTKGVAEVLKRLDGIKITCEWKYDGERAQIHYNSGNGVKIYSRNQEDNTSKYPDVIARLLQYVKPGVESFILDSEIVAWDCTRKQILPFQILSTRKRKNADINDIKVQVCIYAFDLLYLNGKPLVTEVLGERRRLLHENFSEVDGEFKFATATDTNDADDVIQFLEESIKGNCEGLMVKTLEEEATYEIAKRSRNWLKLKKDYMSNVGDSLDLVVIGGYKGRGKRVGAYGGFLLACYDSDNEEYQTICKIGTGFSDEDLQVHANFFKEHVITGPKSYYSFDKSLEPDEWFDAVQVWEIKCADLSLSPVHRAGIGIIDAERGISLRFPRFIRIREDKSAENATSAQQVADLYSSQDQIKNQQNDQVNNSLENDFY